MTDRPSPPARPPDASMTLLTQVMTRPLDPGYAAAATRRRERGEPPSRGARGRSLLVLVTAGAIGLMLGTSWWQTHRSTPLGTSARRALINEIDRQDLAAGDLQRRNADLFALLDATRARQLELQAQGGLAEEVANLGLATGALETTGPGIVVTLDDAPSARAPADNAPGRVGSGTADDGRVLDRDLQLVVNGLWFAGAEAVSINGQRLTAMSAIRSAGAAILVDYRPLSPPYQVAAIGDPARLQPRFSSGPGGQDVQYLKDNYGVRVSISSSGSLRLPASAGLTTRRARATGTGSASGTPVPVRSSGDGSSTDASTPSTTQEAP
jgi:uncharacterized protein YlxW (UPF0749 family)